MKVLSIKQPWAELILRRKKKIEIRKWNTSFRGDFLIHASKLPDKKAMQKFGFKENELPCGFIIGKVKLVDVKVYNNSEEFNKDKQLHLATQEFGNFGFVLAEVKKIKEIPAKGNLGFWNFPSLMEQRKSSN